LDKTPTLLQVEAANAYSLMISVGSRLFISEQTASILRSARGFLRGLFWAALSRSRKARIYGAGLVA
jgi:hypothetical protein